MSLINIVIDFKSKKIKNINEYNVNIQIQEQTNHFESLDHYRPHSYKSAFYFIETQVLIQKKGRRLFGASGIKNPFTNSNPLLLQLFQGLFYLPAFQVHQIIPPYFTSINNIQEQKLFQHPSSSISHERQPQQGWIFNKGLQMDNSTKKASQTLKAKVHCLQQYLKNNKKSMKNCTEEYYETSDSQTYHFSQPIPSFLYISEVLVQHFNISFLQRPMNETFQTNHYNLKVDQQFTKRTNTNIVLQVKKPERHNGPKKILNQQWKTNTKDCQKVKTKPCQKESRNVYSNVLRIFFKCILQLRIYEALIQRILQNLNFKGTKEDFHAWLLGFNINFKNYIRSSQMKRLLNASGCEQFKKVVMILLRHYLKNHAVSHCLTSKRIELSSLKMHLSGLKELYQEATKMKLQEL